MVLQKQYCEFSEGRAWVHKVPMNSSYYNLLFKKSLGVIGCTFQLLKPNPGNYNFCTSPIKFVLTTHLISLFYTGSELLYAQLWTWSANLVYQTCLPASCQVLPRGGNSVRWEEEGRRDFLAVFFPTSVAPATEDSFISQLQLCLLSRQPSSSCRESTQKSDYHLGGGPSELPGPSLTFPQPQEWQLLPVFINIWITSVSAFRSFHLQHLCNQFPELHSLKYLLWFTRR